MFVLKASCTEATNGWKTSAYQEPDQLETLFVDVYVTPAYPTNTGSDDPLKQGWSPTSCTLLHTKHNAVLVDAPPTIAETEKLVQWIQAVAPGKQLKYFFTTHAHVDHFLGFSVLSKAFPDVTFVSTAAVANSIQHDQYNPDYFEATWAKWFPDGQMTDERPLPRVLASTGEFDLDGHLFKAIDVSQGDCTANSFLHVPSIDLVVAGDLVYGDCYQWLGETNTAEKRRAWIQSIEQIESLNPGTVVPGHKRASQLNSASLTKTTKEYIWTFEKELNLASSANELYERMKELYPERWNLFLLQGSCMASFAQKGK